MMFDPRTLLAWALVALGTGCGLTKSRTATEQLVISDAVDRAVAMMDFTELTGKKVYVDTQFAKSPGNGYANADYVLSSIRQQMFAYDVHIQEEEKDADYVVELRIGALGNDGQEVTFGVPAGSLGAGASALTAPVPVPASTPEISVGRRNHQTGAAKIGLFAYHRLTGKPVWQNGISTATSNARDLYILGWGPFQRGKLYERPLDRSTLLDWGQGTKGLAEDAALSQYRSSSSFEFVEPEKLDQVVPASHAEDAPR